MSNIVIDALNELQGVKNTLEAIGYKNVVIDVNPETFTLGGSNIRIEITGDKASEDEQS